MVILVFILRLLGRVTKNISFFSSFLFFPFLGKMTILIKISNGLFYTFDVVSFILLIFRILTYERICCHNIDDWTQANAPASKAVNCVRNKPTGNHLK